MLSDVLSSVVASDTRSGSGIYGLPFSYRESAAIVIKEQETDHDTIEGIIVGFLAWQDVSHKDLWECIGIRLALYWSDCGNSRRYDSRCPSQPEQPSPGGRVLRLKPEWRIEIR